MSESAIERAAARILAHEEVEGDMCFPGQPDAEAWVRRALLAEAKRVAAIAELEDVRGRMRAIAQDLIAGARPNPDE